MKANSKNKSDRVTVKVSRPIYQRIEQAADGRPIQATVERILAYALDRPEICDDLNLVHIRPVE